MPASNERHQQLDAFINAFFSLGKAASKGIDSLADAGETAAPAYIIAFMQSREVLEITEKYLCDLRAMWLCSEDAQPALVDKKEASIAPAELPQPDPECLSPQAFSAKSENSLEHISLPPPSSVVQPFSIPSPILPLAVEAAFPVSPTASSLKPVSAPTQPEGSAPIHQTMRPGHIPATNTPLGKPADPRISFHLPNAKAGQPYAGKLEGKDPSGKAVMILDARANTATGLSFDAQSCELRGMPAVAGDCKVEVRWTLGGSTEYTSECCLFVNPDPRSLWKQIDPPADDPYFKPNIDATLIAGLDFKIAAASRRGRSHEHVGSFRDDDFFVHHDSSSGWSVLMVADGAGSAKSSRWGSKLAVAAAGNHIASKLSGAFGAEMTQALAGWSTDMTAASKAMHTPFYLLFQEASKLAVESIEQEAKLQGVPPKEYATTLLAAAVQRDGNDTFLATFWMGDGAIAAYGPRSKVRLMGMPDSGEFAGQTRFLDSAALTDQGFGKRLVLGRYSDLTAVVLMTDGISDPRFETDNGLADAAKWDGLWDEINLLLAAHEPEKALLEWLHFFTPGHHDDRTIAVLW
ncbi:PP2C family serine/threonine-protein phosphatase [Polaromonas naphthalenivorans]|uniref:PPM-type phosphatase domain-containing protein n=1 Tax=Polaromonas naphthalenivorans (strain CJ2) TaxID=365044 RepID=A1VWQ3_POLNA|nr:PP2C family serine/threonine-protein phosphatase [Polaromonas naphthalenivorans]ABM40081.1 conserved hypothetical protein [Polaromonas naphthalenivorans CJ2]